MVQQTLEFIRECDPSLSLRPRISRFIIGAQYIRNVPNILLYYYEFSSKQDLQDFDIKFVYEVVRELELICDVNLTIESIIFLADTGSGPELPLLIAERRPIGRGIGFEVEEREAVRNSLQGSDLSLSEKLNMSQQYYSSGIALMSLEDEISGLIDAAFMQFYLSIETLLESHEAKNAIKNGLQTYPAEFSQDVVAIVKHVYLARHRFFGHAHIGWKKGQLDKNAAFAIAKQCLVARWCSRKLIALELGEKLVHREMRFYQPSSGSVEFCGSAAEILTEFKFPD